MNRTESQFVFIGSGVAAVALAERILSRAPDTHILILEAGQVYPAMDRRAWWDYVVTGKAVYWPAQDLKDEYSVSSNVNWDCSDNRLIAYGGSTLHWGGWSLRFKPEDFHLRENTGQGADWPFGYDELHDYYYEAEQYLGVCGDMSESWNHIRQAVQSSDPKVDRKEQPYPLPPFDWTEADGEMIEAFQRLGIEPGKMPLARYRKCMATGTCKYCPIGSRYTAQNALDDLRSRQNAATGEALYPNLQVIDRAAVTRIVMRGKRIAAGVEYLKGDTLHQVHAATVVVCAGAYESPKLLMRSATNHWPKGLGNAHDQLGRHLVSHSILRVRGLNAGNKECWLQEYDFPTLMSRTYDTPEYQKFGKLFLFKNRKYPNFDLARQMSSGRPADRRKAAIEQGLRGPRIMELQAFLEEKGRFENYVTLTHESTRWNLPKTHVVFNRTSTEIANAYSRVELLQQVIREMGYEVTAAQVDNPGGHHATGTCRMSKSPREGVTDADLKVHGTENLYVCSNAVFPTGAAVNPTLTLTAITMRLGDHLTAVALHRPGIQSTGTRAKRSPRRPKS